MLKKAVLHVSILLLVNNFALFSQCPVSVSINPDQTGFLANRYIGENTRLIYDIMHYTEEENIPGLLLLSL